MGPMPGPMPLPHLTGPTKGTKLMIEQDLRDRILAEPETLLEDIDVMNALIAANGRAMGANIVDLRGKIGRAHV